ncbi:MAG: hypothetical protein V1743_07480 [Nanoarchaeota archaeon]
MSEQKKDFDEKLHKAVLSIGILAMGFIGVDMGIQKDTMEHRINEIWSDQFSQKYVLLCQQPDSVQVAYAYKRFAGRAFYDLSEPAKKHLAYEFLEKLHECGQDTSAASKNE